jgi:hypothetical protein
MKSTANLSSNVLVGIALLMLTGMLGLARALADQPLSKDDITVLLLAGSESTKVIQTVEQRGVDFQMNPDLAKKFRELGASDDLIEALQKAGNKAGATAPVTPAAGTKPNAPEAPVVTPRPASEAKPNVPEAPVVTPAGTRVRVELETGVSTRYSRTWEEVQATVIEPITHNGQVIIPIGASLSGRIDFIQPKERHEKLRASVRLVFDTFNFPNHRTLPCRAIISGLGFTFQVAPDGDVTQGSQDFELKRGRKLWLQLTEDLALSAAPGGSEAGSAAPMSTAPSNGSSQKPPKSKLKDKHSVRMGELLVTATSIEDEPVNNRSGPPHRIFVVHVRIQNVGKRFPCTSLNPYLVVEPFYEYPASLLSEEQPLTDELLPGETAEGQYSFDIRDGVVPKGLSLKAEDSREIRCTELPNWDWGSIWHAQSEARIPIEGLPAEGELTREVASPAEDLETPPGVKSVQIPPAATEQKREVRQQPGTTIVMDDDFEYRVLDYGVGQVQIRSALSDKDALSQPVFWIEFGITNVSEHLLGVPRYSPTETAALAVLDNWGNDYKAWCPLVKNIWSQATLPVPPRKLGRYKPQESSLDLAVIPLEEFAKDIVELRVYLNRYPGNRDWHFFSFQSPMLRHRNLIQDQFKPSTAELAVGTGEEVQPAPYFPR